MVRASFASPAAPLSEVTLRCEPDDTDRVDARSLDKLRWRCRRGLLENDLFIERFFARYASSLTGGQAKALEELMDLADNDLLDLLLRRTQPEGKMRGNMRQVLEMLRSPSASPAIGL